MKQEKVSHSSERVVSSLIRSYRVPVLGELTYSLRMFAYVGPKITVIRRLLQLRHVRLGYWKKSTPVNLEWSLRLGTSLVRPFWTLRWESPSFEWGRPRDPLSWEMKSVLSLPFTQEQLCITVTHSLI